MFAHRLSIISPLKAPGLWSEMLLIYWTDFYRAHLIGYDVERVESTCKSNALSILIYPLFSAAVNVWGEEASISGHPSTVHSQVEISSMGLHREHWTSQ